MARGKRCIAHAHDYLVPEEHHHLQPMSRGGKSTDDNLVWLCANAHGDVHYFLDLIEKYRDPAAVPGKLAIHFGIKVRQLARAGWARYADQFRLGLLDPYTMLWNTAGLPAEGAPAQVPPFGLASGWSEADHWLRLARVRRTMGPGADGVAGWNDLA